MRNEKSNKFGSHKPHLIASATTTELNERTVDAKAKDLYRVKIQSNRNAPLARVYRTTAILDGGPLPL